MTDYAIVNADEAEDAYGDGGERVKDFWETSPRAAQHE